MKFKEIIKNILIKIKLIHFYTRYKQYLDTRSFFRNAKEMNTLEIQKIPSRTIIINHILSLIKQETYYLEIGVRDPADNFNHIIAGKKYSVDPGVEFEGNPVDFVLTSDDFFKDLREHKILYPDIRFDVILIDGLHLADQVDKDIENSLNYIKDNGFILIHDCNPPTEWHAREQYNYRKSPALGFWNGTTWKAFLKWRYNPFVYSCCINTDWGVGVISKNQKIGKNLDKRNEFYEFNNFNENRVEYLNLMDFDSFKKLIK